MQMTLLMNLAGRAIAIADPVAPGDGRNTLIL